VSERQVGALPHCILMTKFIGRAAAAQKDSNITDFFTKLPSLFEDNGRTHRAPGKAPEDLYIWHPTSGRTSIFF